MNLGLARKCIYMSMLGAHAHAGSTCNARLWLNRVSLQLGTNPTLISNAPGLWLWLGLQIMWAMPAVGPLTRLMCKRRLSPGWQCYVLLEAHECGWQITTVHQFSMKWPEKLAKRGMIGNSCTSFFWLTFWGEREKSTKIQWGTELHAICVPTFVCVPFTYFNSLLVLQTVLYVIT